MEPEGRASPVLWTAETSARADAYTMDAAEGLGMLSLVLMERASLCVAAEVERVLGGQRTHVLVVCGPGNNGGDGLAVARILHARGVDVSASIVIDPPRGSVSEQLALARKHGVAVTVGLPDAGSFADAVIVDGLLGTGSDGAPRGPIAQAVKLVNAVRGPVVAIDLPTGIDPNTGAVADAAVSAQVTVTFQRSKPGLHVTPGRAHAGRVVVADIGLARGPEDVDPADHSLIDPAQVCVVLGELGASVPRHKGDRGHVGLIAGAGGMPGAAILAATAAMRSGAGLATIATTDPDLRAELVRSRPELMAEFSEGAPRLERADALVVGPGLSDDESRTHLPSIYVDDERPAVWDASGLSELPVSGVAGGPRVLTPHPGEAAQLLGRLSGEAWSTARVQSDRICAARTLADLAGAICVLKGAGSVVADPSGRVALAVTGGPSLATAGSGDVLAGIVGALLARGLAAWEAATLGVHVHGIAGDLASRRHPATLAMDVADALETAFESAKLARGEHVPGWPALRLG